MIELDLRALHLVHRMTYAVATMYAEAAAVTLERFHEPRPRDAKVAYRGELRPAWLTWHGSTEVSRDSHASKTDATMAGAYAIAMATAHALEGWTARSRAHDHSGADMILVRPDLPPEDFVKLEVSGVAQGHGEEHELKMMKTRLIQKLEQLGNGDLDLPGIAIVVGFETATVVVQERSR